MWMYYVCLLVTAVVPVVHAAVDADEVTDLPGLPCSPTFKHYSGYLNAGGTKTFHYWFVESQNDPATDPLVLWLNGGPGCSSMFGLLSENGPFLVSPDENALKENQYSWNKVANMLYLDSPAGVGFSYSADDSYATDDNQTALDNYHALKDFLCSYPEFANNDLFIAGESYGGIYVPTLSVIVINDETINFKGFAVGNGISDFKMNANSEVFFAYYHGLMGEDTWRRLTNSCCSPKHQAHSDRECDFLRSEAPECTRAFRDFWVSPMDEVNIYDIYAECHTETAIVPCVNSIALTTYLNNEEVRRALHIPEHVQGWVICTILILRSYRRQYIDVKQQYMEVLGGGGGGAAGAEEEEGETPRILVYSGDTDLAVNFLGSEWFVESLNIPLTRDWQPWYYTSPQDGSSQIAGFTKKYDKLTFVTVKGGSHSVPQSSPAQALILFESFLKGEM